MGTTTYTFEEPTWQGAEVWEWTNGIGRMIGCAAIVSPINSDTTTCRVMLDSGPTSPTFTDPDDALVWVAEHAE